MSSEVLLDDVLSAATGEFAAEIGEVVAAIARVSVQVAHAIADAALAGRLGEVVGSSSHGDDQKHLDVLAHELALEALARAPVAVVGSEETAEPLVLREGAPLAVTIDPLDGSSNIDTNVSIGTIFSILPTRGASNGSPASAVLQRGSHLLAAGFVIYGPRTALVLTLKRGTQIFTLDRRTEQFVLTHPEVRIPEGRTEYAINASNYRHWDEAVRLYVDDCIAGVDGPRGKNFNMRWIASLVAEAYRILNRGGVFLYPADRRPGYERGRLRLVYEAQPLALIIEQAGGGASTGFTRILDLVPEHLHQRTPLILGSADKVRRVCGYHDDPPSTSERSPLFGRRGLFYHSHM